MSTPSICFEACSSCSTGPLPNVDLTFQVDLSQQTISPNGIHVAGNFQGAAGFGSDWNPSSSPMSDPDGDGIYTLTVSVPAGTYQYKFVNGNSWGATKVFLQAVPQATIGAYCNCCHQQSTGLFWQLFPLFAGTSTNPVRSDPPGGHAPGKCPFSQWGTCCS